MECTVVLLVCVAAPEAWQRCLWPWRWLAQRPRDLALSFLPPPSLHLFGDHAWRVASGVLLYSLTIKEERGGSPSSSWKNPREALWLAQFGSCAFPWTSGCSQGNGMLWLARVWVTRSGLWSGWEGALRELCWTGRLPQLPLVFSVDRRSVLCPRATCLPVGQTQNPSHSCSWERRVWGSPPVPCMHMTWMCQCQNLKPGL